MGSFSLSRGQLVAAVLLVAALGGAPGAARADLPDPARFGARIETGDIASARAWLDQGLPPDYMADRIGTGLMIAAWEGNIPMMELFLSRGANINAVNKVGEQALLHAAWKGHLDAVKWLLERGAQLNRPGLQWSALHYAVFAGYQEIVEFLLAQGADINARSTNGSSPLMMAAYEGRDQLAEFLVAKGADTTIRNDWGDDAFVWAMRYGHPQIAKTVGTPGRFAEAARQPPGSFGEVARSNPVPKRIEDLIREMRIAEAEGRLTPELQMAYLLAAREIRQARDRADQERLQQARPDLPRALEISARRGEPGQEKAELIYVGPSKR